MSSANPFRQEIVFIVDNLSDWQMLADAARQRGHEVVIVDSNSDGLRQIAESLSGKPAGSVDAIHLLSHGSAGHINLGNTSLTSNSLHKYAETLGSIGQILNEQGDILLYGCDLTSSPEGRALIQGIVELTCADVAASSTTTGYAEAGGDWVLETHTGSVETPELAVTDYTGLLAATVSDLVTGLTSPADLVVDSQNNLYVVSTGTNEIFKFAANSGTISGGIASLPFLTISASSSPTATVIDALGNLYIGTGSGSDSILKYAASGGVPGTSGTTIGAGFNTISDIWIASDGKAYISDNGANKLYQFASMASATSPANALASASINFSSQIYIDSSNNLYVLREILQNLPLCLVGVSRPWHRLTA